MMTRKCAGIHGCVVVESQLTNCCGISTCGEPDPPKSCSQCKKVYYCDQNCQKLHWFSHKRVCKTLQDMVAIEKQQEQHEQK